MKRAAIITAASAYTIAAADDRMAGRIAAEIVSNASARLGHQLARGLEEIKAAPAESFPAAVKRARGYIESAAINERATLDSVGELVSDPAKFRAYLDGLKAAVAALEQSGLKAFNENAGWTASILGLKPVSDKPTDIEAKALKIVPKPLPKIKEKGYGGYEPAIEEALKTAGPEAAGFGRLPTDELSLLCDGRNNALTIKKMLETQYPRDISLESVLAYLEILKKAGLVDF
jgi:hypothetical protein